MKLILLLDFKAYCIYLQFLHQLNLTNPIFISTKYRIFLIYLILIFYNNLRFIITPISRLFVLSHISLTWLILPLNFFFVTKFIILDRFLLIYIHSFLFEHII